MKKVLLAMMLFLAAWPVLAANKFAIRTFEDVFVPRKWHVL